MSLALVSWCTGAKAAVDLSREPASTSSVEQVFPNSFYLKVPPDDLVNVTRKKIRSPVNINVEEAGPDFSSVLKVGDRARLKGEILSVGPLEIRLGLHRYANSDIRAALDVGRMLNVHRHLIAAAALLQAFNLKDSILDKGGRAYEDYRSFFEETLAPSPFDVRRFERNALKLVGLGSGFTPSFDDFLSGFLCVFNLAAVVMGEGPVVLDHAELRRRTNWPSAKLMDYMQEGLMDEDVEAVVASFFTGDGDALLFDLQDVVGRGHSSGLDLATGLVASAAVVLDLMNHGSLAPKVVSALGF
jgi:hypothetical protein